MKLLLNDNLIEVELLENSEKLISFSYNGHKYNFAKLAGGGIAEVGKNNILDNFSASASGADSKGRVQISYHNYCTIISEYKQSSEQSQAVENGKYLAPMTGTVHSVLVSTGDVVTAGTKIAVLEAMKLHIPIESRTGGVIKSIIKSGILVNEGDLIAEIEPQIAE